MEFPVESDLHVPQETPESKVTQCYSGEAAASAELA